MDKISDVLQDCRTLAQKYIWPDFAPERLPEETKEKVMQLPDTAQLDFYDQYAHRTENLKNSRNISLFFFIFSIFSGIYPISVAIVIYWWFLKENQLPEVADSTLRRTLIKYKLPAGNYTTKRTKTKSFENKKPDFFERHANREKQQTESDFSRNTDSFQTDIEGLRKGFIVNYNLRTWEVVGEYEFNRRDGNSEKTFKLAYGSEMIFLHLWKKQGTLISHVTEQVNIHDVDKNLSNEIIANDTPFNIVTHNYTTYYLDSEAEGLMHDLTQKSNGAQAMIWNYFDGQHRNILRIERFGRADFRVFIGKYVSPFEFSDILRNSSNF